MQCTANRHVLLLVLLVGVFFVAFGSAAVGQEKQSDEAKAETTSAESDQPADKATQPSAEDVLRQVLRERRQRPAIAPSLQANDPTGSFVRGGRVDVDAGVLGVAPGLAQPKLRREGEFIPIRRGRIVRSASAEQIMFVFEADAKHAQEPPMFLMPCQKLENMERIVVERGDKQIFQISGQVFTYRGANYLLPMVMKLAVDKGNLEN